MFDARPLDWDERCTVEALQGLVNRGGPRLYLDNGQTWDTRWLDIYRKSAHLQITRTASLPDLLRQYAGAARGLVVYDPAIDGGRCAALTLAGIEDLLPVSPAFLAGTNPHWTAGTPPVTGLGLAVRHDLRGRFHTSLEACEWALANLMPRTSRWLAHAVDGGKADGILTGVCGPMSGFDWQIMQRGFVFNLGASSTRVDAYGAMVGGSPEQTALYGRVLDAMRHPAMVDGFGDPEDVWCTLLSRHNAFSFHAYHNWSFHAKVPPAKARAAATPSPRRPPALRADRRYFVCFMTSEGDTMKGPIPFFYDSWFDPARGSVPVNWGVNPLVARFFPAMWEYYRTTASPADGFFAGCSGAGYCYPDTVPDLGAFTRHTGKALHESGMRVIDMWGGSLPSTHTAYARDAHPAGITVFGSPARFRFLPDGTPVAFHELGYWQTHELEGGSWPTVFADDARRARAIDHLVDRIERIAARMAPPFVILVYGDLHSYAQHATLYREVARKLDPRRFVPALLDDAMLAMREWGRTRVLVGAESVCEPLQMAALTGTTTALPVTLTNGDRAARVQVRGDAAGIALAAAPSLTPHAVRSVALARIAPGRAASGPVRLTVSAHGRTDRLTGEMHAIPGGSPAEPVAYSGMWYAETLSHPVGKVVADPDGFLGRVCQTPEPAGRTDCIVCGPYAARPAGRYTAAFRIRTCGPARAGTAPTEAVATLEISCGGYAGSGAVVAHRSVRVEDLAQNGEWRWFTVQGDWPGPPNLMELRVQWHGNMRIMVDRVALFTHETAPRRGERSTHS